MSENFEIIGDRNNIFNPKNAFTKYYSAQKIKINHYHTKSLEDYNNKRNIGFADSSKQRPENDPLIKCKNYTHDYTILKYLPKLKEIMGEFNESISNRC